MFEEYIVWEKGEEGLDPYQVPGLLVTRAKTVLAFADGRFGTPHHFSDPTDNPGDFLPHHLVLKRSVDGGRTWSANFYLGRSAGKEIFVFANAVESQAGVISLFYGEKVVTDIHQATRLWLRRSHDDGLTWSEPKDLVNLLVQQDGLLQHKIATGSAGPEFSGEQANYYGRRFFLPGPGNILRLRADHPVAPRRIIVPILTLKNRNWAPAARGQGNCVLFSDDDGGTWIAGGTVPLGDIPCGELNIVELVGGNLLINARIEKTSRRALSISRDGGLTWTRPVVDPTLPSFFETHSGLIRWSHPADDPTGTGRLLFSFPHADSRRNLTLALSYDDHQSWAVRKTIFSGPSYYSNLAVWDAETVLLIYGRDGGEKWAPARVALARISLNWLTDGNDSLATGRPTRRPT